MFGFSEEQITEFGMTFGIGAFMAYMLFIIWNLARESKAGRMGISCKAQRPNAC